MAINTGWHMYLHQRPYVDFPCLLPPEFLMATGFAMRLFGPHWSALTMGQSLFFLGIALAGLLFATDLLSPIRRRSSENATLAAFGLAVGLPQLITVHIWHSTDASQLAVCLLLVYLHVWQGDRLKPVTLGIAIFVSSLLWLSKPNTAFVAQGAFLLFLFFTQHRKLVAHTWLKVSGGGIVFAALLSELAGIRPWSALHSYFKVTERPPSLTIWKMGLESAPSYTPIARDTLANYAFAVAVLVLAPIVLFLARRHAKVALLVLCLVFGVLVTAAGFHTDNDVRSTDVGPLCFAATLIATSYLGARKRGLIVVSVTLGLAVLGFSGFLLKESHERMRMLAVGPFAGDNWGRVERRKDPFFGLFQGRSEQWRVIDAIDQFRAHNNAGREFFGPRLEFEYARLGIMPTRHLPIWWHQGSAYPADIEPENADNFAAAKFDTVYLFDMTMLPSPYINGSPCMRKCRRQIPRS